MLRLWSSLAVGALVLTLLPAAALADEPGADILSPRFDLGIWTIVVFAVLLLVLRKAAWGPMLEGLRKREEAIRSSVEDAHRTREEMEQMRARFKVDLDQEYVKVAQLMEKARADAQRLSEEMRTKAAADIQADRQRMRHELEVARDQALQELWAQAAQLATLISAKAIGRSLSEDDHRRLVDESLREMQHAKL